MKKRNYEMGYDTAGRRIVLDEFGKYVTHIPCDLSEEEVINRLKKGKFTEFDARNQGMQNIEAAQVDECDEVGVAPKEEWPIFYVWNIKWFFDWNFSDPRTFEEYREYFLSAGLTTEQEWQIINAWESWMKKNPTKPISFDVFRENYIDSILLTNNNHEISHQLCKVKR